MASFFTDIGKVDEGPRTTEFAQSQDRLQYHLWYGDMRAATVQLPMSIQAIKNVEGLAVSFDGPNRGQNSIMPHCGIWGIICVNISARLRRNHRNLDYKEIRS